MTVYLVNNLPEFFIYPVHVWFWPSLVTGEHSVWSASTGIGTGAGTQIKVTRTLLTRVQLVCVCECV